MKYKVLFIDWDGTLSNSRFWERWKNDPKDSPKYHLLQKVLFESKDGEALLIEWMVGQKSHKDILSFVSKATNIDFEELAEELRYSAENMKFIDKDIPVLIQQLREKGVKVLIATDNMDTFGHWTVPALELELLFDGILASDKRGALKSDISPNGFSKFFGDYLSEQSIGPNEAALIDNSMDNTSVERFGITFLHVNESQTATDHMRNILRSHD